MRFQNIKRLIIILQEEEEALCYYSVRQIIREKRYLSNQHSVLELTN